MRFEATIDVAAPAQLVFEVYIDVERWPRVDRQRDQR
jgi:hypothetical protein